MVHPLVAAWLPYYTLKVMNLDGSRVAHAMLLAHGVDARSSMQGFLMALIDVGGMTLANQLERHWDAFHCAGPLLAAVFPKPHELVALVMTSGVGAHRSQEMVRDFCRDKGLVFNM